MAGRTVVENVEPLKRCRVETDSSAPSSLSNHEVTRIKETHHDENVVLLRPASEITNDQKASMTSYEGSSRDEQLLDSETRQQQQYSYRAQTLTQSEERVYRYELVERYVRDTTLVSEVANDTLSFQSSESLHGNDAPISEPFHSIHYRDDDVERIRTNEDIIRTNEDIMMMWNKTADNKEAVDKIRCALHKTHLNVLSFTNE
jgi:hypothetical protein